MSGIGWQFLRARLRQPALRATVEGEFSDKTQIYGGKLTLRYPFK